LRFHREREKEINREREAKRQRERELGKAGYPS
jgi:hypothetical protein